MITKIEQAIVSRLKNGLGRMVRSVKSYSGELEDLATQVMVLPAVWVTYGGSRIEPKATGKKRYQDSAEFVVMVATRSLRNEAALRQGGTDAREIGSNDLLYAVRRLLDGQSLGFSDSRGLTPKAVRTLANNVLVQNSAVSVFAIEYVLRFDSFALEDGRYPERQNDQSHPDFIFSRYSGKSDAAYPDFTGVDGKIYDPNGGEVPLHVDLNEKKDKQNGND